MLLDNEEDNLINKVIIGTNIVVIESNEGLDIQKMGVINLITLIRNYY